MPSSSRHTEQSELTAVILTLNEANHIQACIHSLSWADRVLVFDSHSQDDTAVLAQAAGAELIQSKFENYAQQRNAALDSLQTDWVFFVDADERGTPELGAEIRQMMAERLERGWYVPRHNYIFGKLTEGAQAGSPTISSVSSSMAASAMSVLSMKLPWSMARLAIWNGRLTHL